ncbi:hypothetical protein D8674_035025 [Pyrus ussuriensis x Pyrus communis]|uniref:Uncharacterized protein n=1 Tax=Pyrus ussuriensis x Pyrus communis TaxID=2448454 RepID=A0A5N5GB83_9ROSA|nr:hypothetical protein D8674_035025 [Pyrus ussuriensis x Pyrus communis]
MVASEFSDDNFINLDLPPKFYSCPNGSCDICGDLCFEVEKLLATRFETKVEHMEFIDKVDYNFVCDEDLEVYENTIAMDEDFHVQFHQEVKVSHLYQDYVWEDFIARDIMRKPLEFDSGLGLLFETYSSLEIIWKMYLYALK